jgi:hypothetical protein
VGAPESARGAPGEPEGSDQLALPV